MAGFATLSKIRRRELDLLEGEQILMGKVPEWAVKLCQIVARTYERTDLPTLIWRNQTKFKSSSGMSQATFGLDRYVLTLRAGTDLNDQRMVLLHELAHWLIGNKHNHDQEFYHLLFEMGHQICPDIFNALVRREERYKPSLAPKGYAKYMLAARRGEFILDNEESKAAMRRPKGEHRG